MMKARECSAAPAVIALALVSIVTSIAGGEATKLQAKTNHLLTLNPSPSAPNSPLSPPPPSETPLSSPSPSSFSSSSSFSSPPSASDVAGQADTERAGKLESTQKLLDRKLQQAQELKDKLDYELNFMKDEGLLQPGNGAAALQAPRKTAQGQPGALGGMLPDLAAPIIFLEPPPVTLSQSNEAAEVAETTLAQLGDYASPAMKAVREYELKKLGQIYGTNLEQIRKEIRETESAIQKRKKEREELTNKLTATGRELAKEGSRHLALDASFINADLRDKLKELDILAEKLRHLKIRERDLILREGPGKESKNKLEEEESEEEELASDLEEGDEEGL